MFDDNNDEIPLDEFGNPIYQSKIDPNDIPYADAMSLLKSINNRQQPQPIPLLQSLGKPANTAEEQDILSPIPQSKEKSLQKARQIINNPSGVSSAQALINSENPDNKVIDAGDSKTVSSVDNLKKLQDEAKSGRAMNDAAQGFSMIGGAFASKDVRDDIGKLLDTKRAELDKPTKDFEQQIALEKKDPNSPYSKGLKDYIKKSFGYEIKGDLSADDLKDTFLKPLLVQYEGEEARKSKEFIADQNNKAREASMREGALNRADARFENNRRFADGESRKADQYQENKIKTYTNSALSSPEFKKAQETLGAVDRIAELAKDAKSNGGQSLAMLGPQIAKGIAGEVGVLTEQDVTRYINDPSLAGSLRDKLLKAKAGKLSEVSYDNLMRLTDIMQKKAKDARDKTYASYATRLARNSKDLTYEEAYKKMNPEYLDGDSIPNLSSVSGKETNEVKSGNTVRVKKPDGTIGVIPIANLEKAKKQGYVEVK